MHALHIQEGTGSDQCSSETIEEASAAHAPSKEIRQAKVERANSVKATAAVPTKPTPDMPSAYVSIRQHTSAYVCDTCVNVTAAVPTKPTPDMTSETRELKNLSVKDSLEAVQLSWERALPLTLTLDMEIDRITDRESFVGDVVEDVSGAAQIHPSFVKVVGMHAGSVMVDLQIAPEAGDLDQIEEQLVEQVNHADSALRKGKITSKTMKLTRTSGLTSPIATVETGRPTNDRVRGVVRQGVGLSEEGGGGGGRVSRSDVVGGAGELSD
jgi:hypothetical protein